MGSIRGRSCRSGAEGGGEGAEGHEGGQGEGRDEVALQLETGSLVSVEGLICVG